MALRSDDPDYLSRVREFYGEIGKHIGPGADIRRGRPLIGIQIENEYGHCGGPGTDDHIRTLRRDRPGGGYRRPLHFRNRMGRGQYSPGRSPARHGGISGMIWWVSHNSRSGA